jgi:23S rRNA (adenine2503-C2)-methyltransferase
MLDILSLSAETLEKQITALGYPKYRAQQVMQWLTRGCRDFEEMTNLPQALRDQLSESFSLHSPQLLRKQISAEDGTVKCLWGLQDGHSVETVFMRYRYGNSVCISSQVGCRQGCAFCASTIGGLIRSLTPGEMYDEVIFTEKAVSDHVSSIVLMGIGEPLDNLENVLSFLRLISRDDARNIGLRHITLSTCGLPEQMLLLAEEKLPITLAVSLHAPDDATRTKIMPSNRGVESVINACEQYIRMTGRRISFEYAMIDGVNDSISQANLLAGYAKRIGAHVNLIPLNYVEERSLKPSSASVIALFQNTLLDQGVNVTIRRRLGSDIDASCGQLRRKYIAKQEALS